MSRALMTVIALAYLAIGCGNAVKTGQENKDAPTRENMVYPIEYAQEGFTWRDGSHRVYIAFTDDYNYSTEEQPQWSVPEFCDRVDEEKTTGIVHLVWSGATEPEATTASGQSPYTASECTRGTQKEIESDASDLDLGDLPVTKVLAGSILVEYLSADGTAANEVTLTIKSGGVSTTKTFTVQSPPVAETETSASDDSDIPDTAAVAAPTIATNSAEMDAEFHSVGRNPNRIRVSILGLIDPDTGKSITVTAQDSIFLSENDTPMQILVTQSREENYVPIDLVFIVDNSGSMDQEADGIADGIGDFAKNLADGGVDARFGVAGYWGDVRGAVNLTDKQGLLDYLDRGEGFERTMGFEGDDAATLEELAKTFNL